MCGCQWSSIPDDLDVFHIDKKATFEKCFWKTGKREATFAKFEVFWKITFFNSFSICQQLRISLCFDKKDEILGKRWFPLLAKTIKSSHFSILVCFDDQL